MRRARHPRLAARPAVAAVAALATVLPLLAVAGPAGAAGEPISETLTLSGRGWGHGRGLGQWGAFGYATGRSGGPWTYRQILAHFYGDTETGNIANPLAAVTLLGQRGKALVVQRAAGVEVNGHEGTSTAVRVSLRSDGRFDVQRAEACAGPWSEATVLDGPVRLRAPGTTGERDDVLILCRDDGSTAGYRGELVAMSRSFDGADAGLAQTVNLVRLDDLLRSILPNQLPPAWGTFDDGRGMHALRAQAVASRGFAAVGDPRWHDLHSGLGADFTTCDASQCQRYTGVDVEDPITDDAVRSTSGEVRVRDGALVRTEYTASSGGWTAAGTFPAVQDVGDAVSANPHRSWTALIDRASLESRYGLGRLQAVTVLERNGLGAGGGRVVRLALVGTDDTVELTGSDVRADLGLRSDWFTVSGAPPRPPVEPRHVDDACPDGEVPAAPFEDVDQANVHLLAIDCVTWWELSSGVTDTTFRPGDDVTRAQMASFVARFLRAAGHPLPEGDDVFVDDDGIVHEEAINALAALGVVQGVGDGSYAPQEPVERAQTAALVARALEALDVGLPTDPSDAFADDTGSFHEPSINALAAEGIVTGAAAGRVEPRHSTRRDQMTSLLARALDLVVERTGTTPP